MEIGILAVVVAITLVVILFSKAKNIPDESSATHDDILEAIQSGHKVRAIKYYRSVYGVGLAEAKKSVEELSKAQ